MLKMAERIQVLDCRMPYPTFVGDFELYMRGLFPGKAISIKHDNSIFEILGNGLIASGPDSRVSGIAVCVGETTYSNISVNITAEGVRSGNGTKVQLTLELTTESRETLGLMEEA